MVAPMETSPLSSFLLSQSTVLCLAIRLMIVLGYVPKHTSRWLNNKSFQSLFTRFAVHKDFQRFDQTQSWHVQTPIPAISFQLIIFLADCVTASFLVYLANVIRKQQNQDDEEEIDRRMPAVIRPPFAIFATTETDTSSLLSRDDVAHLSGSIYLWGTLLSSSTSAKIYSGVSFSIINVLSGGSIPSDPFVPMFLLPVALTMRNRPTILCLLLLLATYFYFVTLSILKIDIPTFSTPNLGVQWYFSMQIFDRFRHYFAIMFFGLRFVLVLPLCIRFQHLPVELSACLWFVYMIFHPVPTLTDLAVALSLLLLSPRSMRRMGIPSLVALCALPVPLALYILDWYTWLETGSGNANYIYFQCLVYNAFCTILFLDFCGATVRRQTALQLTNERKHSDFSTGSNKQS